MISEIVKLRKTLHQFPELSGAEVDTAKRIKSFINTHHPTKIIENIGGNGLAAVYEFSTEGPVIAIRCELDALPIQEVNLFGHKSTVNGVSHKCGHDGHMAIVSGLIFWLKEQAFDTGKIVLLFQPAEETGLGAHKVMEDDSFQDLNIDYIFALHNIPNEPIHSVIAMDKGFSAEVQSFSIELVGKESHASEPENGLNPAVAIAEITTALSELNIKDPLNDDFSVLTPVHINMGQKSYGISPAKGELHYTIRTWSSKNMEHLKAELLSTFNRICENHQLEYEVKWFEYFPASENDLECNQFITKSAKTNQYIINERKHPFKFGEDFGWFSKKYKTGMFGLGSGYDCAALHNANYDFPDELIETGMNMFKAILIDILQN